MDANGYEAVKKVASEFDCYVTPEPTEGENLRYFDVLSEEGDVRPAAVLNALHRVAQDRGGIGGVRLIGVQKGRITLEDLNV